MESDFPSPLTSALENQQSAQPLPLKEDQPKQVPPFEQEGEHRLEQPLPDDLQSIRIEPLLRTRNKDYDPHHLATLYENAAEKLKENDRLTAFYRVQLMLRDNTPDQAINLLNTFSHYFLCSELGDECIRKIENRIKLSDYPQLLSKVKLNWEGLKHTRQSSFRNWIPVFRNKLQQYQDGLLKKFREPQADPSLFDDWVNARAKIIRIFNLIDEIECIITPDYMLCDDMLSAVSSN